jgi:predicted Zn-dependent protease
VETPLLRGGVRGGRAGLIRSASLVVLTALLLGGCVSEKREQEIGDAMAAQVNAHLPLVHDPVLNAYISNLGRLLAKVSTRPKLDYHFYLINSAEVNAFALPGGYVYVTRGLIEETQAGDELAAVMAHEIGHVAARHGVEKLERYMRTGSLVNFLYTIILGGEPRLLRENALQLTGVLWSASHSREDEEKADQLAVDYLIRAGMDPHGMVSILETLLREEQADSARGTEVAAWFSTHPLTSTRIVEAKQDIQNELRQEKSPPAPSFHITSYPAFLERVHMLPPPPDARR